MRTHASAIRTTGSTLSRSLLSIGLAASAITLAATGALFTDTQTMAANTFATGTVDLNAQETTDIAANAGNLAPGDTVSGVITVANSGTLEYRYTLTSTTTAPSGTYDLASQIQVTVWDEADEDATSDGTCAATPPTDTLLHKYTGALGSQAGTQYFSGETVGTTAPANQQMLCLQATLPQDSNDNYQGLTTDATFTFDAQQTANNPA